MKPVPIPEFVKTLRRKTKISQVDLANKLGISQTWLCLIEGGTRTPTIELLQKIVGAMGVDEFKVYYSTTKPPRVSKIKYKPKLK